MALSPGEKAWKRDNMPLQRTVGRRRPSAAERQGVSQTSPPNEATTCVRVVPRRQLVKPMSDLSIHTSSTDWLRQLALAYKARMAVTLVDDAGLGINPINETLLDMGRKAHLAAKDWIAVLIALGVGAVGAWLIVMAVLDPEPYSKIGFALGAGTVMTMGGGYSAIRVITGHRPPNVTISPSGGFQLRFD
jgi:hypothetical protein